MSIHRRVSVITAVIASAFSKFTHYSVSPRPSDLVFNGGFEDALNGWGSESGNLPSVVVDASYAFTGEACLSYFKRGDSAPVISQTITTAASTTYIVNFHLKPPVYDRPSEFVFKLNRVPYFSVKYDVGAGYSSHTCAFTTPARGRAAKINTISFQGRAEMGFFYFDDVSVVQLPIPCSTEFFGFDTSTGRLTIELDQKYPPPEPDYPSQFPMITSQGQVHFNYKSNLVSRSFPRRIIFALAPPGESQNFHGTAPECQWTATGEPNCPASGDIGFTFRDFEGLFLKECVSRTISDDSSLVTYEGDSFALYMDPYDVDRWSELTSFPISKEIVLHAPGGDDQGRLGESD